MNLDSKKICSRVIKIKEITEKEKNQMLNLMQEFYDNVTLEIFKDDLEKKDYCVMLYNTNGDVKGFSTQQEISLQVDEEKINGIFSGDTIIHKEYWGSLELYKAFARKFIKEDEDYYWFLISKGYKTYKMLPLFFKEFYPNYKAKTPGFEKKVIDTFGTSKFPKDYDKSSGVNKYKEIKDRLKDGVADITQKQLKDKDIEYFTKINPGYIKGEDLVCLAKLNRGNLKDTGKRLLRGV